MAIVYFGSSAFVKLVAEEDGSELASALAIEVAALVFAAWDERLRSGVTATGITLAPAATV